MKTLCRLFLLCCTSCFFSFVLAQSTDSLLIAIEQQYQNKTLTVAHLDSLFGAHPKLATHPKALMVKFDVFFDKENYPLAIKTLLEAKEHAKEFQIRYDILNNLGISYGESGNLEEAIAVFSEAKRLAIAHGRQDEADNAHERILFEKIELGDSIAVNELKQMIISRNYFGDDCLKLQSLTFLSYHYLSTKQFTKINQLYDEHAPKVNTINDCFCSKGVYYEDRATVALHKQNPKQALKYLDSLSLINYPCDTDKISAYETYVKAFKQLGDYIQVSRYQDSITKIQEENMAYFNATNSLVVTKTTQEQWFNKKRIQQLSIVLGVGVGIGILLLLLLGRSSKARKKLNHLLGVNNKKFHDLWVDYQLSVKALEQIKDSLKTRDKAQDAFGVSAVLKSIQLHLQANRDNPHQFIDATKDDFVIKLEQKAPFLNDKERLLCFFFSLGFSHKKIAELLHKTERSIDSSKYRINQKLKQHLDTDIDTICKKMGGGKR